jgi:hypothetical protein
MQRWSQSIVLVGCQWHMSAVDPASLEHKRVTSLVTTGRSCCALTLSILTSQETFSLFNMSRGKLGHQALP